MSKISGPHDTETPCPDEGPAPDTGAAALALMLRVLGLAAEPDQLLHESGTSRLGETDIVRLARRRPVKARAVAIAAGRLARAPLPAIAAARDGTFFILARIAGDEALIQHPLEGQPQIIPLLELEQLWSGRLILMTRRAPLSDLARRFDITWFLSAIGKYRRLLIEVLAASLVLQLLALVSPLFFQVVVDKVLVHRTLSTLDVLMIALAAVALFEAVLGGLRTHIFTHTSSRIDVELGARLFRHLISLPLAYFEARRTGDSVARVRELESIRSFLTSSALTVVIDLGFTLVFVAVMAVYSLPLTLVVLAAVPVYVAISLVVTPLFKARLDEKFARGAESQAFLVEAVNGIETLKAQAVEPQMQRRWEEQLAGYVASSFRVLKLSNIGAESVQLVNKLATAAVLYLGAGEVMDGALTVGELVAFNMLAGRVTQPVLRLAQLWQEFQHTRISIERLGDILNTPAEPEAAGAAAMPPMRGAITFEGVGFRYHPDAPLALDGIDLTIAAGDVIGIVGASGSGKSTLAKLVQRLYVPERGRVMVDGLDVALADTAWLRRQIGVVLQDSILFNRSIRDNIALADPAMPMARVIDAAGLAGAHEFITALPQGYATAIGERGVGLSGGQRQRIAIARALVTGPRLLILDEATSALDYESEAIVQHNMARIAAGRTVLIIAHRLTAVRNCHRIVVLDKGRIAESGTHAELLAGGGRYAGLWRLQAGGHD